MQGELIATSPETFRRTVVSICTVDLDSDASTACVSSLFCDCKSDVCVEDLAMVSKEKRQRGQVVWVASQRSMQPI